MHDLHHSGLKEALNQKSQYLKERQSTDAKVLERLVNNVERLTPALNGVAPEVQTQLSKRIKNFQISSRKTTAEREHAVGEIIQMLEKEIPRAVPEAPSATAPRDIPQNAPLDPRRLDLHRWGNFFDRTMNSTPSSYLDALSQELQSNVHKWEIATFAQSDLYKRSSVVYRREYFIQHKGENPASLAELDVQDPMETAIVTTLTDSEGKVVETITADEQLPSPFELSERMRTVLSQQKTTRNAREVLARLGDPRVLAKWLGCYYLAIQRGMFDEKERAAVSYLQNIIRDFYLQSEAPKGV